jgi:hypothetical protein
MISVVKSVETAKRFPEQAVQSALTKWWNSEALERTDDPFTAGKTISGTLYELLPELDSLTVVNSFLTIEGILGMSVPERLVKPGGYRSRDEFLNDLIPKLRNLYQKQQS